MTADQTTEPIEAVTDGEHRVADLLARMTLEEKAAQVACPYVKVIPADPPEHGAGGVTWPVSVGHHRPQEGARETNRIQRAHRDQTRLGIPPLMNEEALCGVKVPLATILPDAIGQAATWNPALIREMAAAIGRQMSTLGIRQAFAPVCDVARDPRWGRVEETYGEDPYLAGCIATAYVQGIQGGPDGPNVATLKHFIAYSASEGGRNLHPAHAGPRQLHEVFGVPFEMAIRLGGARAVMCSYNQIDGMPVQASRDVLTSLLRDEYGFDGIVISDLHSVEHLFTLHRVAEDREQSIATALAAGLDLELALEPSTPELLAALATGRLSEADLDRAVARMLTLKLRIGLLDDPFVEEESVPAVLDQPDDRDLARLVAEQSIVLLKNDAVDGLPLLPIGDDVTSIAVVGPSADRAFSLLGNYTYPVLASASKRITELMDPTRAASVLSKGHQYADEAVQTVESVPVVSVLAGIKARAGAAVEIHHAAGCPIERPDTSSIADAVEAAERCDLAVVVVGDQSGMGSAATVGEGIDGASCALPGVQRELVEAVVATGTPTVVVLIHGRPFVLGWMEQLVPAMVSAWLPGEEGGTAVAAALFGDMNPGGRVPVSFPQHPGQLPLPYNRTFDLDHPYFDCDLDPVFPFGHGRSYTTFDYAKLDISAGAVATDGVVRVSCTVTNTGDRPGDEVIQLYTRDVVARSARPRRELKGFVRIGLEPAESKLVTFNLSAERLALYDPTDGWVVEPGKVDVMVGASSEDIRLAGEFHITGAARPVGPERALVTEVDIDGDHRGWA